MSLNNPCGMLIKQINDALERQANNSLRSQDLTMAQVTVLIRLNDLPDKAATLKELERELQVAQSTTAGIVARLEQKGFVEGFGDPADKRIKMVRITPKGEQCCISARQNMENTEEKLLSDLSEEERITFNKLLHTVRNSIK